MHAVNHVTIKLMPGETIGIVGESGCGKSTTANVMCGLQSPTSGKVYFKGEDVTKRTSDLRKKMGRVVSVVFQDPATALNPRMIVHDQLLDPLLVHKVGSTAEQEKRITDLNKDLGLSMMFMSHYIQTVLSISDKIVVMNHGEIWEEVHCTQVFENTQDTYTKMLVGAARSLLNTKLGAHVRPPQEDGSRRVRRVPGPRYRA